MPSLLALFAIVVSLSPIRGVRKIAVSISAIVLLTPLALEMLGLVPASYAVEHGRMIVLPRMIDLSSVAARVALIYGVALTIGLSLFVATKIRRNLDALEEEAAARSWQLRQLAPAHATAGPPSEARPGI